MNASLRFAVTSSSTLVATFSSDLNVNLPYERPTDIVIPSSMPTGTYYVIAVMDPSNAISEVNEANNVAVWNQQLVVAALPSCGCANASSAMSGLAMALGLVAAARRRG